MLFGSIVKKVMMQELLNVPGTQLHEETSGGGILWAIYDAYARVMDLE